MMIEDLVVEVPGEELPADLGRLVIAADLEVIDYSKQKKRVTYLCILYYHTAKNFCSILSQQKMAPEEGEQENELYGIPDVGPPSLLAYRPESKQPPIYYKVQPEIQVTIYFIKLKYVEM